MISLSFSNDTVVTAYMFFTCILCNFESFRILKSYFGVLAQCHQPPQSYVLTTAMMDDFTLTLDSDSEYQEEEDAERVRDNEFATLNPNFAFSLNEDTSIANISGVDQEGLVSSF